VEEEEQQLEEETKKMYVTFEVFMAMTMKNAIFWEVMPCTLVRTDVSDERIASIIISHC
jgi:hypothetical protein